MDIEEWKAIPSFEGKYEASSRGRIRRIGSGHGVKHGRIISQRLMNAGYLLVCLYSENKTSGRLVHRLVAEAFLGPCPDGCEVNHKDACKTNNCPNNLEYLTRSANLLHAVETTGAYRGARNSQATIDEDLVRQIRAAHAAGMGYKRLAKHFGLPWGLVRCVAIRKTWAHVV